MEFLLRAHHIFCIQGFRGKGYSREFVVNMTKVIDEVKKDENIKITTLNSPDYICLGCPRNTGVDEMKEFEINKRYTDMGFCEREENIVKLDNLVLNTLNLDANTSYSYKELLERINSHLTEEKFEEICRDCQWYSLGYCREGLFSI